MLSVGVSQQYHEEEEKAAKTGFTQWATLSCEKKKCCFDGSRPFQGTRRDAKKKDNVGAAKKRDESIMGPILDPTGL